MTRELFITFQELSIHEWICINISEELGNFISFGVM